MAEEYKIKEPYDLVKCGISELREECKKSGIMCFSVDTKFELIGKLLKNFEPKELTTTNLRKFTDDELKSMADGVFVSKKGKTEKIIERLQKYAFNDPKLPPTPGSEKKTNLIEISATPEFTKRPRNNSSPTTPSKKVKFSNDQFLDIAPNVELWIANHQYEAEPTIFPEDNYSGWKQSAYQTVKVGGEDVKVYWEFQMKVLKE